MVGVGMLRRNLPATGRLAPLVDAGGGAGSDSGSSLGERRFSSAFQMHHDQSVRPLIRFSSSWAGSAQGRNQGEPWPRRRVTGIGGGAWWGTTGREPTPRTPSWPAGCTGTSTTRSAVRRARTAPLTLQAHAALAVSRGGRPLGRPAGDRLILGMCPGRYGGVGVPGVDADGRAAPATPQVWADPVHPCCARPAARPRTGTTTPSRDPPTAAARDATRPRGFSPPLSAPWV